MAEDTLGGRMRAFSDTTWWPVTLAVSRSPPLPKDKVAVAEGCLLGTASAAIHHDIFFLVCRGAASQHGSLRQTPRDKQKGGSG